MSRLNQALLSCCLLIAMAVGVRAWQLLIQVERNVALTRAAVESTADHLQITLQHAQAVLSSVRATTEAVRRSSASQLGYYEAIGRRTSQLLAASTILLRNTDRRMERLTQSAETTLRTAQVQVEGASSTLVSTADTAKQALSAFSSLSAQAEDELASSNLPGLANNLSIATEQLTASATAAEEALGHINDLLAPSRKGFWRRLLEAFMPRPSGD